MIYVTFWAYGVMTHIRAASAMEGTVRFGRPTQKEIEMPLMKSTSKKAFEKNIKAEIAAGKPPKQAVAIAYSTKREAAKGKPSGKKK